MAVVGRGAALLLVALLTLAAAAGCGRVGPVRPPGPPEQVIYPRAYPPPDPPATLTAPAR
jgi:predicted small lipoprotein YifL